MQTGRLFTMGNASEQKLLSRFPLCLPPRFLLASLIKKPCRSFTLSLLYTPRSFPVPCSSSPSSPPSPSSSSPSPSSPQRTPLLRINGGAVPYTSKFPLLVYSIPSFSSRLFTDRYALSPGAPSSNCNPGDQTWCGGTWNSTRENLDYIQQAGFTASPSQLLFFLTIILTPRILVWISPVNKNYDGPRTQYGDAYTGYWVTDVSQLNPRFGTSADLKLLSAELHRRGMFLMVDLVLNNVMATSTTPDYSAYFFKVSYSLRSSFAHANLVA
jgi:Alpha amylase, catalytic domain